MSVQKRIAKRDQDDLHDRKKILVGLATEYDDLKKQLKVKRRAVIIEYVCNPKRRGEEAAKSFHENSELGFVGLEDIPLSKLWKPSELHIFDLLDRAVRNRLQILGRNVADDRQLSLADLSVLEGKDKPKGWGEATRLKAEGALDSFGITLPF